MTSAEGIELQLIKDIHHHFSLGRQGCVGQDIVLLIDLRNSSNHSVKVINLCFKVLKLA